MSKKKNGGYGCGSVIALFVICAFLIDVLPIAVALIIIAIIVLGVRNNISKQKKLEESKETESNYVTDSDLKDSIQRKNEVISAQNFEISDKNRRIKELERQLEREKEENAFDVKERRVSGKTYISHIDDYFSKAGRLVIDKDKASVGMLQREFKIGFNRADRIMDELCEVGVVEKEVGTAPRKVLMNRNEFEELLNDGIEVREDDISNSKSNNQQGISSVLNRIDMYNNQYDYMTGEDFEAYVAMILQQIGFVSVQLTKGSGDQGVDIIAEQDGMKYAFQCKRYDKPVGNKAVQEVFAGKFFYHCHVAVVVTNNYFTQSAKELAYENGVVLWDRDFLNKNGGKLDNSRERKIEKAEGSIFEKYYFINEDIVQFSLKKGNAIEILSVCKNYIRAANLYFSFYTRLKDDYKGTFDYHIAIQCENLLAIAQNKDGEEMLFGKGDSGEIEIGVPLWMNDARNQLLNKDNKEFMKGVSEAYSALDEFIDLSKKYF